MLIHASARNDLSEIAKAKLLLQPSGPLEELTTTLLEAIDTTKAELEAKHDVAAKVLTSISALSTLFCAVTATTLQMSIAGDPSTANDVVNLLYFLSLILSGTTAVQSLVGLIVVQYSSYVHCRVEEQSCPEPNALC